MPTYQSADEFLHSAKSYCVVDVRAPVEFEQGHIPGSVNIPLFDNQQRAEIGTLYRKQGRLSSVLKALELVGPKMRSLAASLVEVASDGTLCIHCWRGGMRSGAFAWLAEQVDLNPILLAGGYKAYRRHVLESFDKSRNLIVLSGLTGAGKTRQLPLLEQLGEQIIDLESLANHRGSAFGGIGLGQQPTVEQFENELHASLSRLDLTRRVWVEDESQNIGSVRIPRPFFEQIRSAPAVFMDVDQEVRTKMIAEEYGDLPEAALIASIERITKRLGGQNVKRAIGAIHSGNLPESIGVLLQYYDKLYLTNKAKLPRPTSVDLPVDDPISITTSKRLIQTADSISLSGCRN